MLLDSPHPPTPMSSGWGIGPHAGSPPDESAGRSPHGPGGGGQPGPGPCHQTFMNQSRARGQPPKTPAAEPREAVNRPRPLHRAVYPPFSQVKWRGIQAKIRARQGAAASAARLSKPGFLFPYQTNYGIISLDRIGLGTRKRLGSPAAGESAHPGKQSPCAAPIPDANPDCFDTATAPRCSGVLPFPPAAGPGFRGAAPPTSRLRRPPPRVARQTWVPAGPPPPAPRGP